jgi:hypothetical protein
MSCNNYCHVYNTRAAIKIVSILTKQTAPTSDGRGGLFVKELGYLFFNEFACEYVTVYSDTVNIDTR